MNEEYDIIFTIKELTRLNNILNIAMQRPEVPKDSITEAVYMKIAKTIEQISMEQEVKRDDT